MIHDKVVKICPKDNTVTIKLTPGFSFARPVLYLSTDSNNPLAAAMEDVTFEPRLGFIQTGHDDLKQDYDDDKGAYALVPNILKVKISSPADSQQVPTGSLQITGNSTDDAQTDCIVTVALNRKLPYQNATAAGPEGNNDYSNWSFTFNSSYTTIQPGQNRIAARLTCPENATSIKGTHINVTGVPSSADLIQQQQTTNLPPSPSLSTTTAVPLIVSTVYKEENIIRPFQY